MELELFYYDLPKSFIAQKPLEKRDNSKLLVLERKTGRIRHEIFTGITKYLRCGDVLVLNETRVVKCRLIGKKVQTGAEIECFILEKTGKDRCICLLKPYRRVKDGDQIQVGKNYFSIIEKLGYGKAIVEFDDSPDLIITKYGRVPLPPYINNKDVDENKYQTIYAKNGFSAAGPTAGFHFTEKLIDSLQNKGIIFAWVRLDIGLDTFRPIVEKNVEDHIIHSEHYSINETEAKKIKSCKQQGGKVIAVGTTTTRVLEAVSMEYKSLKGCRGKTSLYIYPGYDFKTVDAMITNFHLPYSTLLVMVSAFAGREKILNAYENAKINKYRFYSFGDCMLII
jgi:S-adenosylmethionine:tRNA ribosyltransferase-isomerase